MKRLAIFAALGLSLAGPALAQMPAGDMPRGPGRHAAMLAGLSNAGQATMRAAMRGADPRAGHAATEAARDRMLTILDADRLDVPALRRAMDDEREAATAAKTRHQVAMIAGFQQLTPADRKAFVVNARAMRTRMEGRMGGWQSRHGPDGAAMPPPPQ